MRPTEGEFCWARTHVTCAAGSGASHRRRSPPLRLPAWPAAAAVRAARAAAASSAARPAWFGGSTKIAIAPIIGTTPEVAQEMTDCPGCRRQGPQPDPPARRRQGQLYLARLSRSPRARSKGSKVSYIWDVNDAQGSARGARSPATRSSPAARAAIRGAASTARRSAASPARPRRNSPPACRAAAARRARWLPPRTAAPAATASTPRRCPRRARRAPRPPAWWWRPWRARPATAAVADHGLEEAALCRGG